MTNATDPNAERHGIELPARAYDLIKDLTMIALPAISAGFGTFAAVWGVEEIVITRFVATVAFVILILGILLKISSVRYQANAQVEAVKAAAIETPVVEIDPKNPAKVIVTEAGGNSPPATEVTVTGGSQ